MPERLRLYGGNIEVEAGVSPGLFLLPGAENSRIIHACTLLNTNQSNNGPWIVR